jgi:drug/metabolite transporter (DMT)-like permease
MCFSAAASFTGGAVITAIGVATLTRVKKPSQAPFAAIPLIFGIQQCAEGVLWLTLKSGNQDTLEKAGLYIFLITALVIWPMMIPFSIRLLETGRQRRKILAVLMALGGMVSLFYAYCLIFLNVHAEIQSFHISYFNDYPGGLVMLAFVIYLAVTILPLFVSSVKKMWIFGILIGVSCLVTGIFFEQYLTSVWCFFAALISMAIFWILNGMNKNKVEITAAA